MSGDEIFKRLPTNVTPKHYELTLTPDLQNCTFRGVVKIDIEIKEVTQQIELNCLNLVVSNVALDFNGSSISPASVTLNSKKETLLILFSNDLIIGEAVLQMEFDGELNDSMKGFYCSKYTVGTEERNAATSQFESTYARLCFPCWDEPAIRATFDVILIVPLDRVALSNMNEISREDYGESLQKVTFAKTPLMPAYLLAFVVGEYDYVEEIISNGVVVRVYTPVGKKSQGTFALEVATKVLPHYEKYFQIDYPLPKMDLIAISDFYIGAMENWGLITYRETMLLVDPDNTSASTKQNTALVIAHEIAHMWFGNLVTMEWWTHLWLKEGYATFNEFLCIDELFPQYNVWKQFLTNMFICALELDALRNSHPIEVVVGHPSEVEEIFDVISYNKGSSVIRMIHNYVGEESFRKGMNIYLNRHRFGCAVTENLWQALSESSEKPVATVMSNWTEKTGFPVLSVSSKQDGNNRVLTISQERFIADGSPDPSSTQWIVPVSIIFTKGGAVSTHDCLMDSKSFQVVLEGVCASDWVKINPNSVGFYRAKYTSEMLEQLRPAVSSMTLPPLDRLGILDDLFAMVKAGHSPTVDVLRFLQSYDEETDYTVWTAINNILCQLNQLLSHTPHQSLFRSFGKKLLSKILVRVGWNAKPNETHLDTLLRSLVLHRLGTFGEESVVTEAKRRLSAHLNGTSPIPADLRSAVYKAVLREPTEGIFQQMMELYDKTDLHEEKHRIGSGLGASEEPQFIQKVLEFAISKKVRSQDKGFIIGSVTHSQVGRIASWHFFTTNIDLLEQIFKGGALMQNLIKNITENFASEDRAQEIEDFFQKRKIPGTERAVQQSVEFIRLNAAWLQRDTEAIRKFLSEQI